MLYLCLTAISLTLDSFGVGFAYGLKKIKIGLGAKLVMCLLSFLLALLSISVGQFLNTFLPDNIGKYISILLLLLLGIYTLFSSLQESKTHEKPPQNKSKKKQIFNLFIEKFGISVTIIKYPQYGDFDHSNTIDIKEALYVGLALSLDALGAGIGLGISGQSGILYALMVGGFQFILLTLGIWSGQKLKQTIRCSETILAILPGILLIGLAVYRMLCA